jgi:hypothetical protein
MPETTVEIERQYQDLTEDVIEAVAEVLVNLLNRDRERYEPDCGEVEESNKGGRG